MIDKGYIKYQCEWMKMDAVSSASVVNLTCYRDALHKLDLIRKDADGISVGNISQKISSNSLDALSPQFIISGTQTGHLSTLAASDYALVTAFDLTQNSVTCQGLSKASAESLTHGVIYATNPEIGAIIHVHHSQLWNGLLKQGLATRSEVFYGTPEMAEETQRLFRESNLAQVKIFAMAGHEDGVVSFGENLQIAYSVLIEWGLRTDMFTEAESGIALQLPQQLACLLNTKIPF